MDLKSESVAVRAAEALLDQGYGRPTQAMELGRKKGNSIQKIEVVFVSPGEWMTIIQVSASPSLTG
jgi:hypothetical protein